MTNTEPQTTARPGTAPVAAKMPLEPIYGLATTIKGYLAKRMRPASSEPLSKIGTLLQSKVHSGEFA